MEPNDQITTKEDLLKACDALLTAVRDYFADADNMPAVERNKVYAAIRHRALDIQAVLATPLDGDTPGFKIVRDYLDNLAKISLPHVDKAKFAVAAATQSISQLAANPATHQLIGEFNALAALEWLLRTKVTEARLSAVVALHILASPLSYHMDTKLRSAICLGVASDIVSGSPRPQQGASA